MSDKKFPVGRILRAGVQGFVVGCELKQPDIPPFGSFVRADGITPGNAIYGLVYNISLEDDLFARHFIGRDIKDEVIKDERDNRQIPVEVSILSVGCSEGEGIRQCLPPHPPVTLDWLYQCTDEEVQAFTSRLDYFQLILGARQIPVDELLVASIRNATAARAESEGEMFLVDAGRELARLLAGDPLRLEGLLRRLRAA